MEEITTSVEFYTPLNNSSRVVGGRWRYFQIEDFSFAGFLFLVTRDLPSLNVSLSNLLLEEENFTQNVGAGFINEW